MAPPKLTHCKRGHRFTEKNTRKVKLATGYTVRQCRTCRSAFETLRYHTNPKRQAAVRSRAHMVWELKK